MCSRFTNTLGPDELGRQLAAPLGVRLADAAGTGLYNIAPSEEVLAIAAPDGQPEAELLRFGLLPGWAAELKDGSRLINARLEGLLKTGKFASVAADQPHRALVIADGWIEWRHPENRQLRPEPISFTLDGGRPFAFASLRTLNRRIASEPIGSCAIITCAPDGNHIAAVVHDRMPVVLADLEAMRAWIDPDVSVEEALSLCGPLPEQRTSAAPISTAVNRPGVEDGPWLLEPPAETDDALKDHGSDHTASRDPPTAVLNA